MSDRTPQGDVTRLPKWAQEHIILLEGDLRSERERLAVGPEDSNTFVAPYRTVPQPLGHDPVVRFYLNSETAESVNLNYIDVRLTTDHTGEPAIRVSGGDALLVMPSSSNLIFVRNR